MTQLKDIHDYIARRSPQYARRVVDRVTRRSQQIARYPMAGIAVPIEIIALFHGARQSPWTG
jgi:toxin ParE1/3/4